MNRPTSKEINNPQNLTCMKDQVIARQKAIEATSLKSMEEGMLTALHGCQEIFGITFPRLPAKDQEFLIHMCFYFGKDRLSKVTGMFNI